MPTELLAREDRIALADEVLATLEPREMAAVIVAMSERLQGAAAALDVTAGMLRLERAGHPVADYVDEAADDARMWANTDWEGLAAQAADAASEATTSAPPA